MQSVSTVNKFCNCITDGSAAYEIKPYKFVIMLMAN